MASQWLLLSCQKVEEPAIDGGSGALALSQVDLEALLEEIRENTDEENPFFGDGVVRELRAKLKTYNPLQQPGETLEALMQLGIAEVEQGDLDSGIARLNEAHALMELMEIPPAVRAEIKAQLGIAYFRLGESENCCANHSPVSCIVPLAGEAIHTERGGSEAAIKYFAEVLQIKEADPYLTMKSVWLTNLAYMTLGEYPQNVPRGISIPSRVFQSKIAFPRFPNVAGALKVDRDNLAGGAILDDFDGDGDLDLVTSSWDSAVPLAYFRNDGKGRYEDRTQVAGLMRQLGGLNLTHADYDNDGDLDILVLRGAWMQDRGRQPNSLLQNQGNGTFIDRTFESGLGKEHLPTQTAAWADYDNDGDLDLYVGNETNQQFAAPCQLFQNKGDGTFIDVAQEAGVTNNFYTKGVAWGDVDGDRWPDLIVSNLNSSNRLYHNQGDGTFIDVAKEAGIEGPTRSFPLWTWDFNNDGHLDIFISAYNAKVGDFVLHYLEMPNKAELPGVYQGDGTGAFRNVAEEQGLQIPMLPMGSNFGDLNNDGFLDFYLGTGEPLISVVLPNMMFLNQGGESFEDVTMAGGFGHLQKGHGVVFADYDEDGDQDVFEQMGGAKGVDKFRDALYANPGFGNHWLKVKLQGKISNRNGIGARIRVDFKDRDKSRSVYRFIGDGGSFGSNPYREHIGLGWASTISRLEIFWPTSNTTQVFENVAVDQFLEITEGQDSYKATNPVPARQ